MIRLIHFRSVPVLLVALVIATSVRAQTAAGPVRAAGTRLDAARLATPAMLRPVAAADPSSTLAGATDLSRPHLYYSAPLAAVLGVGGMLAGYAAGLGPFGCEDESSPCAHGPDDFEYTLAYTGLALGAATGAHLGGKTRDSKGSFWATLGGAAVGALPILIAPKDNDQTGAWVGSMMGGTAGAVLVDYFVRGPRR